MGADRKSRFKTDFEMAAASEFGVSKLAVAVMLPTRATELIINTESLVSKV